MVAVAAALAAAIALVLDTISDCSLLVWPTDESSRIAPGLVNACVESVSIDIFCLFVCLQFHSIFGCFLLFNFNTLLIHFLIVSTYIRCSCCFCC